MYEPLIFIHSWTRWAVLFGTGLLLWRTLNGWFRNKKWTSQDNHLVWAYTQVFGYQLLFGLTLYLGISPMTKASFMNLKGAWANPILRFWSVQHISWMISAFVVFQIGKHLSYKKTSIENRHRALAFTTLASTVILLCGIPWPYLVYGRSWFRGFW